MEIRDYLSGLGKKGGKIGGKRRMETTTPAQRRAWAKKAAAASAKVRTAKARAKRAKAKKG